MKSTLCVLATNISIDSSKTIKLENIGSGNESIIDHSICDAIQDEFSKVVFIIKDSFEEYFNDYVLGRYKDLIEIEIVLQRENNDTKNYEYPQINENFNILIL